MKNKKIITFLIAGFFLSSPILASSEYKIITNTIFFEFASGNEIVDSGYIENNHPCVEKDVKEICNYENEDLLVV